MFTSAQSRFGGFGTSQICRHGSLGGIADKSPSQASKQHKNQFWDSQRGKKRKFRDFQKKKCKVGLPTGKFGCAELR